MKRYILTVGPSLLYKVPLKEIHAENNIYRINAAHGTIADIEGHASEIRRQVPDADVMVDLPGNKVRVIGAYELKAGETVDIPSQNFNYPDFWKLLSKGMKVWANDSIFELEVYRANEEKITFLSRSTGTLTNNKGMHVRGIHSGIPFLFEKDKELISLANKMRFAFVGLSFVRSKADIEEAKSLIDSSEIIAKTETLEAVQNLNDILDVSEYIAIDRGDLSTEIGIENIPRWQDFIIDKAHYFGKKVFVATQVLKNMETKPIPTIAEIDDLYALSKKGIYGVQMSEETAVGLYVKECVETLRLVSRNILRELV